MQPALPKARHCLAPPVTPDVKQCKSTFVPRPRKENPAYRPASSHCQINVYRAEVASGGTRDHSAVTAFLHWFAASARRIRRVERETGWRSRLKVLWTAACMLRKRCA